jgi:Transposase
MTWSVPPEEVRVPGDRLDGLTEIGVDELSYRKHHEYVTIVTDHTTGRVVWAHPGKNADTLRKFFEELGKERCGKLRAVTVDMSQAYIAAIKEAAPQAKIVFDRFHVQRLVHDALDAVRRTEVRDASDPEEKRALENSRFVLQKNPWNLGDIEESRTTDGFSSSTSVCRPSLGCCAHSMRTTKPASSFSRLVIAGGHVCGRYLNGEPPTEGPSSTHRQSRREWSSRRRTTRQPRTWLRPVRPPRPRARLSNHEEVARVDAENQMAKAELDKAARLQQEAASGVDSTETSAKRVEPWRAAGGRGSARWELVGGPVLACSTVEIDVARAGVTIDASGRLLGAETRRGGVTEVWADGGHK